MNAVLIAAAGTGGHVVPAIAVAEELVAAGVDREHVHFIGTEKGVERRLVPAAGFPLTVVGARPLERRLTPRNLGVPAATWRAAKEVRLLARALGTTHFVGFGGFVTLPAVLGVRRRVPVVLHEQNAQPGLANRLASRYARAVAVTFPEACARLPRCQHTGNPVRPAISRLDRPARRAGALARFGLDPDRTTVLVMGGSQGAARLNAALPEALATLAGRPIQILALAGAAHVAAVAASVRVARTPVRVEGFVTEMEDVYAAADIAVTRAGAGTCAELACAGLPAVLVPYPFATADHQSANAVAFAAAGAAMHVPDSELTGTRLAAELTALLDEPARVAAMAAAMAARARPDAAAAVARLVLEDAA